MNTFKDKLIGLLGGFGLALWSVISIIYYFYPIVAICLYFDFSFITSIFVSGVLFVIKSIIPFGDSILWFIGLIAMIVGKQDFFAYLYYILFALTELPILFSMLLSIFRKKAQ